MVQQKKKDIDGLVSQWQLFRSSLQSLSRFLADTNNFITVVKSKDCCSPYQLRNLIHDVKVLYLSLINLKSVIFFLRLKQLLSSKVKSFKITCFWGGGNKCWPFFLKLSTGEKTVILWKAHYTRKLPGQCCHLVALYGLKILLIWTWKCRVPGRLGRNAGQQVPSRSVLRLINMAAECRPCGLPEGSRHMCGKTGHMAPVCAGMGRSCQEKRIKHLQGGLSLEPPLQDAQTWAASSAFYVKKILCGKILC